MKMSIRSPKYVHRGCALQDCRCKYKCVVRIWMAYYKRNEEMIVHNLNSLIHTYICWTNVIILQLIQPLNQKVRKCTMQPKIHFFSWISVTSLILTLQEMFKSTHNVRWWFWKNVRKKMVSQNYTNNLTLMDILAFSYITNY